MKRKKYCDNYHCDNRVQYVIIDILGKKHKVCDKHINDYGKIVEKGQYNYSLGLK